MECGVPQWLIQGPLIIWYMLMTLQHQPMGILFTLPMIYTSLYLSDPKIDTLHVYEMANIELKQLYEWFCANWLSNSTDPKSMHKWHSFGTYNVWTHFDRKSTKFLGLYIDELLSLKSRIAHINNTISHAIFVIKQVKNYLQIDCLKTLYYAIIHPHLTYGILAWGNVNPSVLHKTKTLQKHAIRTIHRAQYNSHTEQFGYLIKGSVICGYYNVCVCMTILTTNYHLYEIQESYQTEQTSLLLIERSRPVFASQLHYYTFPIIWNTWINTIPEYTPRLLFPTRT